MSIRLLPFEVDPEEVTRLGTAFTAFVNALLEAECSRSGILGWRLRVDSQTNTADGGVDAVLLDGTETDWIPPGNSAWQFKGGPFGPAKCAEELEGAQWAQDLLRAGASYIMVIAARMTARAVANREKALRDKASAVPVNPFETQSVKNHCVVVATPSG